MGCLPPEEVVEAPPGVGAFLVPGQEEEELALELRLEQVQVPLKLRPAEHRREPSRLWEERRHWQELQSPRTDSPVAAVAAP